MHIYFFIFLKMHFFLFQLPRGARSAPPRGSAGRARGPTARGRGGVRGSSRGIGGKSGAGRGGKPRGSMAGKRKFDSGHQNQGASKRRFQNSRGAFGNSSWGNQPIPQQPRGASGGDVEWYQDSFGQQWA